jgi:hypothetical protein
MANNGNSGPGGAAGKPRRRVSATEAARNFSEMVNRVRYNGETFVVERGGTSVCEIGPAACTTDFTGADLVELLKALPSPGKHYLGHVEDGIREQPPARETRWRR